jgi:hypothetical protein
MIFFFHICYLKGGQLRLCWLAQGITMLRSLRATDLEQTKLSRNSTSLHSQQKASRCEFRVVDTTRSSVVGRIRYTSLRLHFLHVVLVTCNQHLKSVCISFWVVTLFGSVVRHQLSLSPVVLQSKADPGLFS